MLLLPLLLISLLIWTSICLLYLLPRPKQLPYLVHSIIFWNICRRLSVICITRYIKNKDILITHLSDRKRWTWVCYAFNCLFNISWPCVIYSFNEQVEIQINQWRSLLDKGMEFKSCSRIYYPGNGNILFLGNITHFWLICLFHSKPFPHVGYASLWVSLVQCLCNTDYFITLGSVNPSSLSGSVILI